MNIRSKMIRKLENRKCLFSTMFCKWSLIGGLDVYHKIYNGTNEKVEGLIEKLKRNKLGFAFFIFHYLFMLRKLTGGIFMVLHYEMLCHDMAEFNNMPPSITERLK